MVGELGEQLVDEETRAEQHRSDAAVRHGSGIAGKFAVRHGDPAPYPSGAGTVMRAGMGTPKSKATTSLTVWTPPASVPLGSTWYMTATR
jgi:hypothetical protein